MKILGIDLGSHSIKFAVINAQGKKRTITHLNSVVVDSFEDIPAIVNQFIAVNNLQSIDRVAVGIGNIPIVTKVKPLPFADSRARMAMESEFEDSLPVDFDDSIIEIKSLGKSGKSHHILSGLCSKKLIADLNSIFTEYTNVKVDGIFYDVEAIAQLVLNQGHEIAEDDEHYAVIDIGHSQTKVAILQGENSKNFNSKKSKMNGKILELRSIARGTNDLIEWIEQEHKGLNHEEIQKLIYSEGKIINANVTDGELFDGTPEKLSDSIKTALRPLIVEIYQTLQSVKTRLGIAATKALVSGRVLQIENFDSFLSTEIRIPIHKWEIFKGFDLRLVDESKANSFSYAVAVALAHKFSYSSSKGWLNFKRNLSGTGQPITGFLTKVRSPEVFNPLMGIGMFVLFLFGYSFLANFLTTKSSKHMHTELKANLRSLTNPNILNRATKTNFDYEITDKLLNSELEKANESSPKVIKTLSYLPRVEIMKRLSLASSRSTLLKEVKLNKMNFTASYVLSADKDIQAEKNSTLKYLKKYTDPSIAATVDEENNIYTISGTFLARNI